MRTREEEYLDSVAPDLAPVVSAVAAAVREAAPELNERISYRILMWVKGRDPRNFVCAIDTTKRGVALRFLFAKYMADPHGLLRMGSSIQGNIDYASLGAVDPEVIREYVQEAADHHEEFKERWATER